MTPETLQPALYVPAHVARQLAQELDAAKADLAAARSEAKDARERVDELEAEQEFVADMMDAFEWKRINLMSVDDVRAELKEHGYTDERINAGIQQCKDIADRAAVRAARKEQ